jgi:hypothetical protein
VCGCDGDIAAGEARARDRFAIVDAVLLRSVALSVMALASDKLYGCLLFLVGAGLTLVSFSAQASVHLPSTAKEPSLRCRPLDKLPPPDTVGLLRDGIYQDMS